MAADNRHLLSLSSIGQTSAPSRWRTEAMRAHRAPRLIFFTKGQGRITIAGLTSGYTANNLIFLPAGTMYGFEVGPTTFGHMLAIPHAMAGEWPESHVHLRLRDVHMQKDIASAFDSLERELKSDRAGHARAAHYHLGLLAVLFERALERQEGTPPDARAGSAAAQLVAAFTALVERDYAKGRAIADFARALGVTPTHLTRCVRRTCGKSAHDLLTDRILYEARRQLSETRRPVAEIAAALGFSSPAYFSRAFHAAVGVSPSRFRRQSAETGGISPRPARPFAQELTRGLGNLG
ncbi:helix-turn-helix domain-containing protein [Pseudoroseicyclus sp. CXY001]|uniref:helix-turn-helix domain-containing protein n=1 Tax=Pseudoroseicyclus sp. CXY001 TaxID=3242492 RepID=UPI00358DC2F5